MDINEILTLMVVPSSSVKARFLLPGDLIIVHGMSRVVVRSAHPSNSYQIVLVDYTDCNGHDATIEYPLDGWAILA